MRRGLVVGAMIIAGCHASSHRGDTSSNDLTPAPHAGSDDSLDVCAWNDSSILSSKKPDLSVSADGKYLAYTLCDTTTMTRQVGVLQEVATGARTTIEEARAAHRMRFTADSRFVYYLSEGRDSPPNPANPPRVEVRSIDGAIKKSIPFFSATAETTPEDLSAYLADDFVVEVAPDGKTAVAFGRQFIGNRFDANNHAQGRLVVSPLDRPGETTLSTPTLRSLGPVATLEFSPTSDSALLTTSMDESPIDEAGGLSRKKERAYEIGLGQTSTLLEQPPWAFTGAPGPSLIVPGTFDGKRVIRWDYDPTLTEVDGSSRYTYGRLVVSGRDGAVINLSLDGRVKSELDAGITDGHLSRPAHYTRTGDDAPIVFVGTEGRGKDHILFLRPDAATPSVAVAGDLWTDSVVLARDGNFLYPTKDTLSAFDSKTRRSHAVYRLSERLRLDSNGTNDVGMTGLEAMTDEGKLLLRLSSSATVTTAVGRYQPVSYVIANVSGIIPMRLKAPSATVSKLTPFGTLPDARQCGYDTARTALVGDMPVLLTTQSRCTSSGGLLAGPERELDADRGDIPPEVWIFDQDADLRRIRAFSGEPRLKSPTLTVVNGASRVVVSGCDSSSSCVAKIVTTELSTTELTDGGSDGSTPVPVVQPMPSEPKPTLGPKKEKVVEERVTIDSPKTSEGGCTSAPSGSSSADASLFVPLLSLLLMRGRRRRAAMKTESPSPARLDPEPAHHLLKTETRDAEDTGRACLVAAGLLESIADELGLERVDARLEAETGIARR